MTFPSTETLDRWAFWPLFAVLGALFTLPILIVWHPPAMDLPGHLALAEVLASRHSHHDPYSGLFSLPSWPSPNTLYYYLVGGLARFIPIEWASKTVLCLSLLGTPLALAAARQANGQGRALALTGFPLALSFNFIAGFVGFVMALPLMVWLGALAKTQVHEPTRGRAALIALVATITYLCHAQVFLFAVGLVGLIALCGAWAETPGSPRCQTPLLGGLRRFLATTSPILVPIALALPWYLDRVRLLRRHGSMDMRFPGLEHNLRFLPIHTFDQLAGDRDLWLGLGVVAGMLGLAALSLLPRYRARPSELEEPPGPVALLPSPRARFLSLLAKGSFWLATLAAVITYFALPGHIRFQAVINGRQAIVALLLMAVAIRVPRGRLPVAVLTTTIALGGAYGAHYASATLRLDEELRGFPELLRKTRPGSRLVDPYRPKTRIFRMDVLRHLGSYHMVWSRGLVADTFARWPVQPIRTTRFFHMPGFAPHRPDPYHYVLSGRPLAAPRLSRLGSAGFYHLYQVLPAPRRAPTTPRPVPSGNLR
ncbi:MAG: hypothetical protein RBU30_03985 [Polyangia bacterium]|nr:hypothetical protein [Polyangia bacterium]